MDITARCFLRLLSMTTSPTSKMRWGRSRCLLRRSTVSSDGMSWTRRQLWSSLTGFRTSTAMTSGNGTLQNCSSMDDNVRVVTSQWP
ncbi:hypothetical protein DSECCO2_328560 [anaerobic digester metagenome]